MSRSRQEYETGATVTEDIIIVPQSMGTTTISGDPRLSDLQGYSRLIRSRWWHAFREEQIANPIVIAVHKRSRVARERGLSDASEFTFLALDTHDAVREGWLHSDLGEIENRPPTMGIILASGESVQSHVTSDLTETGILDLAYFDATVRQKFWQHAEFRPYLEAPWTWQG